MKLHDLFSLQGKVALVTGAASGLGQAMAGALAACGANIILSDVEDEECRKAAKEIASLGVETLSVQCDVGNEEEVQKLVVEGEKRFGRIDILVNNAAIARVGTPEEFPLKQWEKIFRVNLTGVFLCSQAVGRLMIRQEKGKIINMAAAGGLLGIPSEITESFAYETSKGGVVNLTRSLAVKWAKYNINVNAIAPAWVYPTRMTQWLYENRSDIIIPSVPMKRWGKKSDFEGIVVFLASPASDYITGQIIPVDGGYTAM